MIKDFSKISASNFSTDICIIGSGAAGFTCALSLLNSGLNVILVEGGVETFNEGAADLHKGEITGHSHNGIHNARERIFGGTTTKWGGQALPFMKEDFEKRPHVDLSGWPISLDTLIPFYKKAECILGTDVNIPYDYMPWLDWNITMPKFQENTIGLFVTKWCKIPNFAIQHGSKIKNSNNITVLINANVTELIPTENKFSVQSLTIKSLDGKEGQITSKYIIAAGGALETVRLFLISKQFHKDGLGNEFGLVGSYFQDHVAAVVGQIFPKSRKEFQQLFNPFYKHGFKYFPRIRLNPNYALANKLLHASGQIVFSHGGNNTLDHAKIIIASLRKKELPSFYTIKAVLNPLGLINVVSAAFRWKIGNRGSSPKIGPIWLEIHSEQNPDKESYIKLSHKFDSLEMQRIVLHWNVSKLTINTLKETAKEIKRCFEIANVARIALEPWIEDKEVCDSKWIGDVYHQAGGLRMAENEFAGVVDSSCKVFGLDNLYVASSAVFPTSSFSNPTMTTIALAIRITETIHKSITDTNFLQRK